MLEVYGLSNCDNTRKILKKLKDEKALFRFIDLKETPPPVSTIEAWINALGVNRVLNRKSTTWRGLEESEKENINTIPEAAGLMHRHPGLIKRPLISNEKSYFTVIK